MPKNNNTPLDDSIANKKREELRAKLREKISNKSQQRSVHSHQLIKEQTEEVKQMMKHPKMNNNILKLYGEAIAYNPVKTLAKPTEIFEKKDEFKTEYYQYILSLLKQVKEQNLDLSHLDKLLDNPYSRYMSTCLECPINPFKKNQS